MKCDVDASSASGEVPLTPSSIEPSTQEAIAIIGFALKFPQDVTSEENMWKLLMERRSTMTEVPSNRWNLDGFYKPEGNRPGMVNTRGGHFIADDPARFDAPFFSIQPAEAECMDPQQRFLLETSYHALENAGIPMEKAMGSKTSVHVGCLLQEYSQISQRDSDMPGTYQIVGSSGLSMLSNRLSWFYDFRGPSMTVDTACSGGLLAMHLACQDLLSGTVDMAVACGSNLSLVPDTTALLSALNMMSPDSTCYSFDERANGYSRSEGFGVILMKRLSQAISDGDTIRAVVRSTGCNSDGHTPGITQPSQSAQEQLTRETYQRAGLDLDITRYFEAHGTGTMLGDPTEARAISNSFPTRTTADPLYIGALKSNIGHPESASGIAGVIKTVLVLEAGVIPPNRYPERINPIIASSCTNLNFPLAPIPWPTENIRRASVSSFGYGGTNVHVVIDDILSYIESRNLRANHRTRHSEQSEVNSSDENGTETLQPLVFDDTILSIPGDPVHNLLVLSAFDEYAVQRSISLHEEWLRSRTVSADVLADLAFTLASKRSTFPWKTFSIASSESVANLSWSTSVRAKQDARVCFIFTGQGAQYSGMGRELFRYEAFRKSVVEADQYFKTLGSEWSLSDELQDSANERSSLDRPELSQPVCTALQVAIVDLLSSWKISASTVVGHSSGEIAAAYASGAISRESAWQLAYFRGLAVAIGRDLMNSGGSMVAVLATPELMIPLLETHNVAHPRDEAVIACYNSSSNLTISGSYDTIGRLETILATANITFRLLKTGVAYHSHHMEPVAKIYRKLLRPLQSGEQSKNLPLFISTVTGEPLEDLSVLNTSEYWLRNLVAPVQFSTALKPVCADKVKRSTAMVADMFIEIGPHSTLRSPLKDLLRVSGRDIDTDYTSVLIRKRSADITALECAGKLFASGAHIDLAEVNHSQRPSDAMLLTTLPPYPFNDKTKYWLEGRTSAQYRFRNHVHNEFLGLRVDDWNDCEARWTNRVRLEQSPWLKDHQLNGSIIFPAAGFMVMTLEAARQMYGGQASVAGYRMKDVKFPKAVTISQAPKGTELQITLRTASKPAGSTDSARTWNEFFIFVYENDGWVECCSGTVAVEYKEDGEHVSGIDERVEYHSAMVRSITTAMEDGQTSIISSDMYDAFSRAGLSYGPFFQSLQDIRWNGDSQATGAVELEQWRLLNDAPVDSHLIHPTALDAILQLTFPAFSIYDKNASATTVPTGFRSAWFPADIANASGSKAMVHAKVIERGFRNKCFAITAALVDNKAPIFIGEMETSTIGTSGSFLEVENKPLYRVEYQPDIDLLPNRLLYLEPDLTRDSSLIHDKELLCLESMRDALGQMSNFENLPLHLQEYVKWMKVQDSKHTDPSLDSIESMCQRLEHIDVEARLLVRVARNLPSILAGEMDPLTLLFTDEILSDFYSNHSSQKLLSRAAGEIRLLAHKYPAMNVLEVGAGTGSATGYVLGALGERVAEYMYTDVTPSFFIKAKEKFVSPKLTFKTLDISQDPVPQGFPEGGYDLIIVANVLHAANGIRDALTHCRTLLRPKGRIIILEMTNREHLIEPYIFGILPGLSQDTNPESAIENSTFLAESEWAKMLLETGFSGLETCISSTGFTTDDAVSAVMFSKAMSLPNAFKTQLHVIHDDLCAKQMGLLQHLIERTTLEGSICIVPIAWNAVMEQGLAQSTCLFLIDLDGDLLGRTQQDDLDKLKRIVSDTNTLVWPTFQPRTKDQSPVGGLVTGLARTLATENEDCRIVSVSLDASSTTLSAVDNIIKLVNHCAQTSGVLEDEYIERDGLLQIPRVVLGSDMSAQIFTTEHTVTKPWRDLDSPHLTIGKVGHLSTLHFEQAKHDDTPLEVDDILVEVKAVGLSNRDILVAQGQVYDEVFGSGFAGVVSRTNASSTHGLRTGERIFGIGRDTIAQTIRCKPFQLQKIPADMDFCEAASYPVAYCTAYYSLVQCARIKKEDTVLIHRAAGEFGQAALQISQLHECEVLLTVDRAEQATFLNEKYGISRSHILSSTSLDLGIGVRRLTDGRGVDVVLNSLVGEAARQSWDCLAPFGRFINLRDPASVTGLPMGKSRMFVDINIHESAQDRSFGEIFSNVHQLIESKKLKSPNLLQIFNQNNVVSAFQVLQHGDYTGRIAIKMASDEPVEMALVSESKPLFDPRSSYLIAGGFGGIGQSTARWMVQNGARSLILPSRTSVEGSGSAREELIQELRAQGADVRAPLCDIANRAQLEEILRELSDMPPIKGCIQAAMVMRDSSFANMTIDDWHASLAPKLAGSWNLHQLLPSDLDFFVMFSSSTGIMGSFGQSNYTAGNTYQDALAAHRVQHGQRAHAIAMSMVVGVGWVAENAQVQALLRVRGMLEEVSLDDIYELLRFCCNAKSASVGSQIITSLSRPADLRALGIVEPLGSTRPIYSHMHTLPSRYDTSTDGTIRQGTKKLPSMLLQDATTLAEATDIITEAIQSQLSSLLVVSKDDIDPKKPIHKYGVDSMVAVEMRNWFSKGVGADVGTTEILDDIGIAELAVKIASKSRFVKEELKS